MSGDPEVAGGRPPDPRPAFLPPVPPAETGAVPRPPSAAGGRTASAWGLAGLLTASVLLVSAFLPWAVAGVRVRGLDPAQDLVAEAGVNVDGTGQVVPVFALVAIVMIVWGLLAADPRIFALASVPALLALLSSGIFLLRLDRFRQVIGVGRAAPAVLEVSAGYGWYLAVAASLLLIGLSVARPAVRR
ncbi:hypothetical protein [Thermomonospora umbrina]|uniref:Uncharacterized protein n=1 Tax=Thermomonospora umbrina TaxID=111806 RepID=A0A3D9STM3_9ACTN|nr:hypothetical protein [Thermomonospora umbrina]REE99306.1 hypothetical protein DFJ69_4815 [Thermomonospora umbrina]